MNVKACGCDWLYCTVKKISFLLFQSDDLYTNTKTECSFTCLIFAVYYTANHMPTTMEMERSSSIIRYNWLNLCKLKIPIQYMNSPTLKTLLSLFTHKFLNISYRTKICTILAYFA